MTQAPPQRDPAIKASNFGGLNTTSTSLSTPPEDSPRLLNVDVDISGKLTKRKGTRVIQSVLTSNTYEAFPITTNLGYPLLVTQDNTTLYISQVINNVNTTLLTVAGQLKGSAQRFAFYLPKTPSTSLILLAAKEAPVEISFYDQRTITTVTNVATFVGVSSDALGVYLTFVNGVFVASSVSSDITTNGIRTVVLNVTSTIGSTVDVVSVAIRAWYEAITWFGDNFNRRVQRLAAAKQDQIVAVPTTLLTDGLPQSESPNYGIFAYIKAHRSSQNNLMLDGTSTNPTTAIQYSFSDGQLYTAGSGLVVQKSQFFVTFGTFTGAATDVFFVRYRRLKFNKNTGILPGNLVVISSNRFSPPVRCLVTGGCIIAGQKTYFLHLPGALTVANLTVIGTNEYQAPVVGTSTVLKHLYISFDSDTSTVPFGIGRDETVTMYNSEQKWGVTNARLAYGFGDFANYQDGIFPIVGTYYQGRCVLSGVADVTNRVVFSAVNDEKVPNEFFNYFQITDDLVSPETDPFDVIVPIGNGDYITNLTVWQQYLFIFCRSSVYRSTTAQMSALDRTISLVTSKGALNQKCVVTTEGSILFVSETGLFEIAQLSSGEYQAGELSTKVRSYFDATVLSKQPNLAWMSYNRNTRCVYIGLPKSTDTTFCSTLLVYNIEVRAWTEYDTHGNFQSTGAFTYTDRVLGTQFALNVGNSGRRFVLKMDEPERYVDFLQTNTGLTSTIITAGVSYPNVLITADSTISDYDPKLIVTGLTNTPEFQVSRTNTSPPTLLIRGTDYTVLPNGLVRLTSLYNGGLLFIPTQYQDVPAASGGNASPATQIYPDMTQYPILAVWRDKVRQTYQTQYRAYVNGVGVQDGIVDLITSRSVQTIIEYGVIYPAYYYTPVMNEGSLSRFKRLIHWYVQFSNALGKLKYVSADRNAATQTLAALANVQKIRLNCYLAMLYQNDEKGEISGDIYDYSNVVQDSDTSLFKEALQGIGYDFQGLVFSVDDGAWTLEGYQIDGTARGKRFISGDV